MSQPPTLLSFTATCPRSEEVAVFTLDRERDAYLCNCSTCKDRLMCRSAVTAEQLDRNPDGDTEVLRCFCYARSPDA